MSYGDEESEREPSPLRAALHAANLLRWEAIRSGCPIKQADADRAYLELTRDARVGVTRERLEMNAE